MEKDKQVHEAGKDEYIEDFGTVYNTITYKKETCRDLYVVVAYKPDDPQKIEFIRINSSSKVNNCAVSFMEGLADMLTFSIRRIRNEHEARAIIKNLRHQKCLNCPPNKDHSTSCSDAIAQVLEKVLKVNGVSQ